MNFHAETENKDIPDANGTKENMLCNYDSIFAGIVKVFLETQNYLQWYEICGTMNPLNIVTV